MADNCAYPVRAIVESYNEILRLTEAAVRIVGGEEVSTSRALQITESVARVQTVSEQGRTAIIDAYNQGVAICGAPFPLLFVEDSEKLSPTVDSVL